MGHRKQIREEQQPFDDRDFPGLNLNIPCSARGGGDDDGRSIPTSFCHILNCLSRWNRFLWHVGLQLRELRGPGKLSLVRLVYGGSGGVSQRACRRSARIIFHVLLARHSCVESLHLDDVLIEGSGLGEYRECVVSPLWENTSLRTLFLGSLFSDYRSIRGDLFRAVSTMINLRQLVILGSGAVPVVLLDSICLLLVNTVCLTTLLLPGLVFNEQNGKILIIALQRNDTVEHLSLHGSIVHSYLPSGLSRFSRFLSNSLLLTSLSVEVEASDPESTYVDLLAIIAPLIVRGKLRKLRLAGYLLNTNCAILFASIVSQRDGSLESLDISGCRWKPKPTPERGGNDGPKEGQQTNRCAFTQSTCAWIQALDHTARMKLSFLALSFQGLRPQDLWPLFNTAVTMESLQVISLRDVPRQNLRKVCLVIRETGMTGRVRLEGLQLVDYGALVELREFPQALGKVAVSSVACSSPKLFGDAVHLACAWYPIKAFKLLLTQEVLSDVRTIHKLSKCIRGSATLKELVLIGYDRPNLEHTLRPGKDPHSVLLDAIFANNGIGEVRLTGFRLGQANMWFLAEKVVTSETLYGFSFTSWDPNENDDFVQLLAGEIRENDFIVYLYVAESASAAKERERFVIDDVVGRNLGYITCAAYHVVHGTDVPRCVASHGVVSESPFLRKRVQQLGEELEETCAIESILE
ncbi:hypothetical protein MRX96_049080 [Rhipicephalus microplus]